MNGCEGKLWDRTQVRLCHAAISVLCHAVAPFLPQVASPCQRAGRSSLQATPGSLLVLSVQRQPESMDNMFCTEASGKKGHNAGTGAHVRDGLRKPREVLQGAS